MPAQNIERTGEIVAGRYQITGLVGRGGMGAVYRARQENLRREVALKVIRKDLAEHPVLVERFRREAEVVAQLNHANIVTVHDFGETERGELYIAMELLEGVTLTRHIKTVGAVPWADTLPVVRGIAAALAKAHARGVVHRDLKPDNVMLVADGTGSVVKVLDFGVARVGELVPGSDDGIDSRVNDSAPLTSAGMIIGSPGYLAPEALLGGSPLDARADLYGLGLVWLEMLRGQPLVAPGSPAAMLLQNAQVGAAPLEALAIHVTLPGALLGLLSTLLQPNPLGRPADGAVFLRLLDDAVAGLRAGTGVSGSLAGTGSLGSGSLGSGSVGSGSVGSGTLGTGSLEQGTLGYSPNEIPSAVSGVFGSLGTGATSSGTLPYTSFAPGVPGSPERSDPQVPVTLSASSSGATIGSTSPGTANARRWPLVAGAVVAALLGAGGTAIALRGDADDDVNTASLTVPLPPGGLEAPGGAASPRASDAPPPVVIVRKVEDQAGPGAAGVDNRPQGASGRADETDVDEPDRSASGDDEASSARTPKPKPKAKPRAVKARKPPGKSSTIASKRSPSREPEEVEDPAPKGPAPLTSDDIRVGIRQNTGKANRCRNTNIVSESGYGLVVDHCPSYKTPDGQHRIELDIARDGSVTRAVFLSPAAGGSDIGGCVLETLKTQWSFPESTDGAQKVRMPVRFQKCVPIGGKCVFKG